MPPIAFTWPDDLERAPFGVDVSPAVDDTAIRFSLLDLDIEPTKGTP